MSDIEVPPSVVLAWAGQAVELFVKSQGLTGAPALFYQIALAWQEYAFPRDEHGHTRNIKNLRVRFVPSDWQKAEWCILIVRHPLEVGVLHHLPRGGVIEVVRADLTLHREATLALNERICEEVVKQASLRMWQDWTGTR